MTVENFDQSVLENKFKERDSKLPNGIRKHIRRLKEEGRLADAINFRKETLEKKRNAQQRLEDKLNENLRNVLLSENPEERAKSEFAATWILSKTGEIPAEERQADLESIYRAHPDQDTTLSAQATSIVAEISKLAKEAGNF